jgi:diadenosine tetraphosphate (Ap4A) HIT family hydrolase
MPVRIIEENAEYMAFLTIFPNTPGATVVIPRIHASSYFALCDQELINGLMSFAQHIARVLDDAFTDVGRTALVFEGYGVDHLHAKLFPMHGTPKPSEPWRAIKSSINSWSEQYQGYISSHDCDHCDDEQLDIIHKQILANKVVNWTR